MYIPSIRRRWFLIGTVTIAGAFAAVTAATMRLGDRGRAMAIDLIEERFEREVELEELTLRVLPSARASGRGMVVHQKPGHDLPPFIAIESFDVDVNLLTLLLFRPIEIERVEIRGLEIHVPPDGEGQGEGSEGEERDDAGSDDGGDRAVPAFLIEEVNAPDTQLYIHSRDPGDPPLLWDIQDLRLESAGTTDPMLFDATLRNAKPPGLIRSAGSFGPWREDDLAATPVSGEYTFDDADLSVFGGIRGTLSSEGRYSGVLGRLDVVGTTDTPDFALDISGKPIHLKTEFETVVDGTNGDTLLEPVRAWIGGTALEARGGVVHREGIDGKTISLDVVVPEGRLQDLLTLGIASEEPFMTGTIRFEAQFLLPQGDQDVIDKLRLDGSFGIERSTFAEPTLQEKIDTLSSRSRGEHEDPERVASNFAGDFTLESAILNLSRLTFQVPGADVELEGTYGLKSEQVDMRGKIHMDARLSEATTGFKSFLLKLVDPFFGGDRGNGASIPIKITGTRDEPDIGLNLGGE